MRKTLIILLVLAGLLAVPSGCLVVDRTHARRDRDEHEDHEEHEHHDRDR